LDKQSSVVDNGRLLASELRTALALAGIFFVRMLGLFMLLPVLALYLDRLVGATPLLLGAAIGIYGFTQAALQIPLGRWSDRIGRKPIITGGLLVFAAGGVLAALTGHIYPIIAGRAVQGAGAISGTMLALAADNTRPEQRTKVMAIIGISIGVSFSVAFVLGPIIDAWIGLTGLFWVAAILGILALPILWFVVPDSAATTAELPISERSALARPTTRLAALFAGVFCLHGILAASFIAIPLMLRNDLGLDPARHYTMYLPVLIISLLCVGPLIKLSHRDALALPLFRMAIICLLVGEAMLWIAPATNVIVGIALISFFVGFNYLEASLPSMVSQAAPDIGRGAALGTYSMAQFMGMFVGGLAGGGLYGVAGYTNVFGAAALAALLWLAHTLVIPVRDRDQPTV
jgi:MFS family permease